MPEIKREGRAVWKGGLKDGTGTTTTQSGFLNNLPYSVPSRFENAKGTNPEELIAAAHASCFSMMLAKILGDQGKTAQQISTTATLTMRMDASGPKISAIHLVTEAQVPGLDENAFQKAATEAKEKCPVSTLLRPGLENLTMEARLKT